MQGEPLKIFIPILKIFIPILLKNVLDLAVRKTVTKFPYSLGLTQLHGRAIDIWD